MKGKRRRKNGSGDEGEGSEGGGEDDRPQKKFSNAAAASGKKKRKRVEELDTSTATATVGQQKRLTTEGIRNKQKREEIHAKLTKEKKKEKKKRLVRARREEERAMERGEEPPARITPHTIESLREVDANDVVRPDDEETATALANDEFADHYDKSRPPNVLITTCRKPTLVMYKFVKELLDVFPHATYYKRANYEVKEIVTYAKARDFTDLVVINENRKTINGLLVVHLPNGPTAHFKLSNLTLRKDIKNHGKPTKHKPELILNNFSTKLGHRVGRMFGSLFNQDPQFRGRRAVTFHNQRDFIFFRHHRYIFEDNKHADDPKKLPVIARLQELGPRFTLKLMSLQKGTFDSKNGEFEYTHRAKVDNKNRRRFVL
eukprot:jgi/Chlat1/3130/Chrsp21S00245